MTELEKIEYAKSYIDKLANGINPLTGQPVADSDIVNHVRISRCLTTSPIFFVKRLKLVVFDLQKIANRKNSPFTLITIREPSLNTQTSPFP